MSSLLSALYDTVRNDTVLKSFGFVPTTSRALNQSPPYVVIRKGKDNVSERTKHLDIIDYVVMFEIEGARSDTVRLFSVSLRKYLTDPTLVLSCDDGVVHEVFWEDGDEIVEEDGIHSTVETYRFKLERRSR